MSRVGDISSGEFDFEPLKGESAGEPIYLSRLSRASLVAYQSDLQQLAAQFAALIKPCRKLEELQRIAVCLGNVQQDIQQVLKTGAK